MLDIESKKYSSRKEYEYDDDIGILFYKGQKVTKSAMEDYRGCWLEEDEYFDELETKRELAIMHEVRKQPGFSILDQVDNTIWEWEHEKQVTRRGDNNRYKLKYKY